MCSRRVVVTGIGALTPLGNNLQDYWQSLKSGVSGADNITHFDASNFKTQFACELKEFNVTDFIDRISSTVDKKLTEKGIKPYIIPLDQGRLIDNERFQKIDVGLDKEQIIYLIGKPPLVSPFIDNQWNYIYFNNTDSKKHKMLSIHFKNEKVFEILINNISFKKLGVQEDNQITLDHAPINNKTRIKNNTEKIKELRNG